MSYRTTDEGPVCYAALWNAVPLERGGTSRLVAVSLEADPKVVPPYVRASKLTFPVALDP